MTVRPGGRSAEVTGGFRLYRSFPLSRFLLTVALGASSVGLGGCSPQVPETPEQPIAYSHAAHIEAGLECERCHRGAFEQRHAGLPPLATCVSCHRRTIPEHPEVVKVLAAYAEREPIPWRKVNVIPESSMVQFNHGAHARAEVGCGECHGDVASMTVAQAVLNVADMGWCLECHRERGASDDCLSCHY